MRAERDEGGSIILHWHINEIKKVIIPIIDMTTQTRIASLIQESFKLRAESERLLEIAKKAVETAIEQDENIALNYLTNNLEGNDCER